ncbi:MAG: glycosyltransferase family 2 protein [Betaproteobacteria bacterium]
MQCYPTVTVVMPAFNAAATVRNAVQSVLDQTYRCLELLVVDDASTDDTLVVLNETARSDPRIRVLSMPSNGGAAEARNAGLRAARGELIAFLDADDLWLPNKLELQVPLFSDNATLIVGSWYDAVSSTGIVTGQIRIAPTLSMNDLLNGIVIGCLTAIFRREALHGSIGFRSSTERANGAMGRRLRWRPIQEDYLFWLDLMLANPGYVLRNIQASTARYTLSTESASSNKCKAAYFHWMILRHDIKLSLGRAILYFVTYAVRAVIKHVGYRWGGGGQNAWASRQVRDETP